MAFISSEEFGGVDTANTGTQASSVLTSLTVPAGCKLAVMLITGYESNGLYYSSAAFVKMGTTAFSFPTAAGDTSTSWFQGAICYIINPPTGTQVCTWDWNGAGAAGEKPQFVVSYYDNVVSGVRNANGDHSSGANQPFTSPSITASSGDLVVAGLWSYSLSDTAVSLTSPLTKRVETWRNSSVDIAMGDATASGAMTVEGSTVGAGEGGILGIAFIPSAGGSFVPRGLLLGVG